MSLKDKNVVVTGGSRGLGLGLVEALVDQGARVTVVARQCRCARGGPDPAGRCHDLRGRHGRGRRPPHPRRGPAGHPRAERRREAADGAIGPDELGGFHRALGDTTSRPGSIGCRRRSNLPLKPGSRVLVVSSGAAVNGSPMSGGYGGAKRMLWFMAKYANGVSEQRKLGIRFQTIVPRQMILGTGIGDAAAGAYARAMDIEPEAFVARFGAPMPPRVFGEKVVAVLDDPTHAEGFAFGLTGDTGVTIMEGLAA